MPVAFVETMRGTVRDTGGVVRSVDFHVRASGGGRGRFALSGVVHAAPWAEETVASGTMEFALWPPAIDYDVRFRAADGRELRLFGAKKPSLFRPLESMTVLAVTLADEAGAVLAEGALRFDLMDLPGFLSSWLPAPTKPHRQLDARRAAVARRELA